MALRGKRGAYFFVLDAFIAGLTIVSFIAVVLAAFSYEEPSKQSYYLAEDFATFLEQTQIKRYAGEAVFNMTRNGNITNEEYTLLEQAAIFYSRMEEGAVNSPVAEENLRRLLAEVSSLAPENSGILYAIGKPGIDPDPVYWAPYPNIMDQIAASKDAHVKLSAHRIVTIFTDRAIIGPYIVEVQLWR